MVPRNQGSKGAATGRATAAAFSPDALPQCGIAARRRAQKRPSSNLVPGRSQLVSTKTYVSRSRPALDELGDPQRKSSPHAGIFRCYHSASRRKQ